jgi:AcrR family transcriptional regulator
VDKEQKEGILDWALHRFREKGVRSVTMDEIAAHAGISKRTLYEQFGDKEQLLIECLKYHWAQERQILADYAEEGNHNVLELILFSFNQKLAVCRDTYPGFTRDVMRYRRVMEQVRMYDKNSSREFIAALKLGVEQGLMRGDIRFELFEEFLTAQMRLLYEEGVWRKYTPQEVFRMILLVWLRGISTEEGGRLIDAYMKNEMGF